MQDLRYIYWDKEAEKEVVSDYYEWNDIMDTLDWSLYIPWEATYGIRTHRGFWLDGRWSYQIKNECPVVYIGYELYKHVIISFNSTSDGIKALKALKAKMKETNGKLFEARFGGLPQDKENLPRVKQLHEINRCVGPFVGNASLQKNQWYDSGVYKADVSSAYPAAGRDKLPTLKGCRLVNGYVEPSEEWPIVFYLKNHHIAEYGVFDTHEDMQHELYKWYRGRGDRKVHKTKRKKEMPVKFLPFVEDELCLCCKYSEYDLKEFDYFYDLKSSSDKEEAEIAKGVMNKSIGTFDMVDCPDMELLPCKIKYFGHLRAIICARHNHNMIKYYDEIVSKGYKVIQVQTDSIIWQGGMIESATREKAMGKLHLEIENGKGFIHGCGAYWVEDNNTAIEKHQGIRGWKEYGIDSLEKFREFFETTDNVRFEEWRLNPETLKYELI